MTFLANLRARTGGSYRWPRGAAPPAPLIALIAIVEIGAPGFVTPETLTVVLSDTAVLFILAAGQTFVILIVGIALSIQSGASLASVVLAQLLPSIGLFAFPVAVVTGFVFGLASGYVHVRL